MPLTHHKREHRKERLPHEKTAGYFHNQSFPSLVHEKQTSQSWRTNHTLKPVKPWRAGLNLPFGTTTHSAGWVNVLFMPAWCVRFCVRVSQRERQTLPFLCHEPGAMRVLRGISRTIGLPLPIFGQSSTSQTRCFWQDLHTGFSQRLPAHIMIPSHYLQSVNIRIRFLQQLIQGVFSLGTIGTVGRKPPSSSDKHKRKPAVAGAWHLCNQTRQLCPRPPCPNKVAHSCRIQPTFTFKPKHGCTERTLQLKSQSDVRCDGIIKVTN